MIKSIEISIYETKENVWILSMQWTDERGFIEHLRKIRDSKEACISDAGKEIKLCQTT